MTEHHSPSTRPTLLVTVGSTLFTDLTDTILSTATLDMLSERISSLRVQIGRSGIPGGLAHSLSTSGGTADGVKGRYKGMEVDVFRYTDDFEGMVKQADLVVSHAGSGSILTALRAGKPLLVVPNTDLMDNHQAQLADELAGGKYLVTSTIPTLQHDLEMFVERRGKDITPFPEQDPTRFRGIMDELMGFDVDHL